MKEDGGGGEEGVCVQGVGVGQCRLGRPRQERCREPWVSEHDRVHAAAGKPEWGTPSTDRTEALQATLPTTQTLT